MELHTLTQVASSYTLLESERWSGLREKTDTLGLHDAVIPSLVSGGTE